MSKASNSNHKEREVVFSKAKKSQSVLLLDHRKCKRKNCLGCSNHYDNYIETTSRDQYTIQKSRSRSQNKTLSADKSVKKKKKKTLNKDNNTIETERDQAQRKVQAMLREEVEVLQHKLEAKKKKVNELKAKLKVCQQQLQESRRKQAERHYNTQEQKQVDKKKQSDVQKNLLDNVIGSQALAKETLEKYRSLEEEYSRYRHDVDNKISKIRDEQETRITRMREEHQQALSRQKQEYESLVAKLQENHQQALKKFNKETTDQREQLRENLYRGDNKIISQLKEEVRVLERANKELRDQLLDKESEFLNKEHAFKQNLHRITEKVENWSGEVLKIKQIELENDELKQRYFKLLEKYRLKKLKHREATIEWGEIFREMLDQVGKLKRDIDILSTENVRLKLLKNLP